MDPISLVAPGFWRVVATGALGFGAIATIGIGVQTWRLDRSDARGDRAERQVKLEVDAHRTTKANWRAEIRAAGELERKRLVRVKGEQGRVNSDAQDDYRRRLADLRARYDRLRREAGAGDDDQAGAVAVPGLPAAAGGAARAAGDHGLSADRPEEDWRFVASQQALQLDALISWIRRQHGIDPN